jgi:hypothetical protein
MNNSMNQNINPSSPSNGDEGETISLREKIRRPKDEKRPGSDILKRFFQLEGVPEETLNSDNLNPVDIAELTFLEKFKNEIQNSDLPFLENMPRDAYILEEQVAHLAHKLVVPLVDPSPLVTVIGPKVSLHKEKLPPPHGLLLIIIQSQRRRQE